MDLSRIASRIAISGEYPDVELLDAQIRTYIPENSPEWKEYFDVDFSGVGHIDGVFKIKTPSGKICEIDAIYGPHEEGVRKAICDGEDITSSLPSESIHFKDFDKNVDEFLEYVLSGLLLNHEVVISDEFKAQALVSA